MAWWLAVTAAIVALATHLLKAGTGPLALGPALLLVISRPQFTVRSEPWSVAQGVGLAVGVAALAFAYGRASPTSTSATSASTSRSPMPLGGRCAKCFWSETPTFKLARGTRTDSCTRWMLPRSRAPR